MTTAEKYEFDCTTSTKRSRKRKQTKIQADLPTITLQCNQTQYWEKLQTRNTPNLGEMTFQGLSQKTIVLDSVVIPFFTGVLTEGLKINGFLENTAKVIQGEDPLLSDLMKGLFTGEFDGKMSIDAALNLLALKDKYMMNSESILEPIDLAFERTQDIKIEQVWTCLSVANHYNLDSIQDLKKCIWEHQHDF